MMEHDSNNVDSVNVEEVAAVGGSQSTEDEGARLLLEKENSVRKNAIKGGGGNNITSAFINVYSSILMFAIHLISLECLLSIALSVYFTIYTYRKTEGDDFDGSVMSWTLLSFAVITPMTSSIRMAFSRREVALSHLSVLKSTLLSIYSAHACWNWATPKKEGRDPAFDWLQHTDKILKTSVQLCNELTRLLTLPTSTRARHRVTCYGRKEAKDIEYVMTKLHLTILDRMGNITDLCEDLKYQGLPPNEATRIRQWERMLIEKIEMLLVAKKYRTPQALRSFARLFSIFLPPLYAPFYSQMATEMNSLAMGITFSVITCIALTALFESIVQIEDPFTGKVALDGIDVSKELGDDFREQLLSYRLHHFANAQPFQMKLNQN